MASLKDHILPCLQAFDVLSLTISTTDAGHDGGNDDNLDDRQPQVLSLAIVNDQVTRFKIWAGNIGADQKGRSSLDYRLREASHLRGQTIRLLGDLCDALRDATSILSGEWACDKEPQEELTQGEEAVGEPGEQASTTELDQISGDISEIIDCLFRLSVSIRNPAPHDRFKRAIWTELETTKQEHLHAESVCAWFRDADEGLTSRLGRTIAHRRRDLFYSREQHYKNLVCDYGAVTGNHEDGPALPTRLLEVGSSENPVRLVTTIPGATGSFTCLSYAWGLEPKPPIQTLTSNYAERMSGIAPSSLSRTFQDAIAITRSLGIPYLWIDSLCIIQDDDNDRVREVAQMGRIFENGRITIMPAYKEGYEGGYYLTDGKRYLLTGPPVVVDVQGATLTTVAHVTVNRGGWPVFDRIDKVQQKTADDATTTNIHAASISQQIKAAGWMGEGNQERDTITEDKASTGSGTTTTSSLVTGDRGRPRIPPLPKDAASRAFECPYCFTMLSATTTMAWRKHVLADLRPYICLSPDCHTPEETYQDCDEWMQHMLYHHWRTWTCTLGCDECFESATAARNHLAEIHADALMSGDIEFLAGVHERVKPRDATADCPLCHESNLSIKEYARHVGRHQRDLSLFSLPLSDDDEQAFEDLQDERHDKRFIDDLKGVNKGDAPGNKKIPDNTVNLQVDEIPSTSGEAHGHSPKSSPPSRKSDGESFMETTKQLSGIRSQRSEKRKDARDPFLAKDDGEHPMDRFLAEDGGFQGRLLLKQGDNLKDRRKALMDKMLEDLADVTVLEGAHCEDSESGPVG